MREKALLHQSKRHLLDTLNIALGLNSDLQVLLQTHTHTHSHTHTQLLLIDRGQLWGMFQKVWGGMIVFMGVVNPPPPLGGEAPSKNGCTLKFECVLLFSAHSTTSGTPHPFQRRSYVSQQTFMKETCP